ncbi:MAG TPA: hypothetical protein VMU54_15410 [Planctomycetota bacterium]|nr:hypothetical protein [Planctomycetota bacterium]
MLEEPTKDPSPDPFCESASRLISDWRKILCRVVDEAEILTREKPVVGLAAAFLAGAFLSSLFRRR